MNKHVFDGVSFILFVCDGIKIIEILPFSKFGLQDECTEEGFRVWLALFCLYFLSLFEVDFLQGMFFLVRQGWKTVAENKDLGMVQVWTLCGWVPKCFCRVFKNQIPPGA